MIHLGKSLRVALDWLQLANAAYDEAMSEWRTQNADIIKQRDDAEAAVKFADNSLRDAILHHYEQTGERPDEAFASIRLNNSVFVSDKTELVVWLVNNHLELIESLIKIDDRTLTNLLKSAADIEEVNKMLDGIPVELIKRPVATISKDKLPEIDSI